jgi:single-strand DNA-binding protein
MVNTAILLGRVGKEVESAQANGKTVAKLSLATTESYKDKSGEKVENTTWHNIVVWGALADICVKYLQKGSLVYLEGKITNRSWDDKDGNKKYMTEIVCSEMKMLGGKNEQSDAEPKQRKNAGDVVNERKSASQSAPSPVSPNDDFQDLPF